ncbi:MAG: Rrf2 family transcriptional regulator [Thermodesulfobacteriota bacterium]
MLTISTKSKYGLKAILALAENEGQGLLQIKEIARLKNIPRQYLEQIFNQLGKARIIRSVRGKNGGYKLARPAREILASEVITLLEGGIEFVADQQEQDEVIDGFFLAAEEKLLAAFSVSLEELVARQHLRRNVLIFDI